MPYMGGKNQLLNAEFTTHITQFLTHILTSKLYSKHLVVAAISVFHNSPQTENYATIGAEKVDEDRKKAIVLRHHAIPPSRPFVRYQISIIDLSLSLYAPILRKQNLWKRERDREVYKKQKVPKQ